MKGLGKIELKHLHFNNFYTRHLEYFRNFSNVGPGSQEALQFFLSRNFPFWEFLFQIRKFVIRLVLC
jgi:hypothetical protein